MTYARRGTDLPVSTPWVRFLFAPVVTEWQGLSLTRILAGVFAALPFVRPVNFNDAIYVFVILGAIVAKDNFQNFRELGKLIPRFGRRDTDPVRQAAVETAVKAEETKDAAKDVIEAIDKDEKKGNGAVSSAIPDLYSDDETGDAGEPRRAE